MNSSRYLVLLVAAVAALALSSFAVAATGLSGTYRTTIKSPAQLKGTWSIAFAKGPENGIAAVYTMRLDGSHIQQVTHSTYWDSAAAWGATS